MPRTQKQTPKPRHDPLFVQLNEEEVEAKYGRISQPGKRKKSKSDDHDTGDVSAMSFCTLLASNKHIT